MIYDNNHQKLLQRNELISALNRDKSAKDIVVKEIDGESIFINAKTNKHFKFVDPEKKWIAELSDIPAILNQLR